MPDKLTILIADDHPIFRRGLRQIIETVPEFCVVAEAENGAEALRLLRELRPQIAILDVEMPRPDGLELAGEVRKQHWPITVMFLTMYREERFFNAALDLGVKGYLLKDSAISDIVAGIRAVAAGQHFITPALSTYLVNRVQRAIEPAQQQPGLESLTSSERRVLQLVANGKTSRQIANELSVSQRTIEHHRANIMAKLNLKGGNALLQFAINHQLEL
ncbi:MAG TPA: response regulator transcription factor [Blastocatellia bacterium]|nr:response regulator transcription factor [Blastocatellia bacterium]HMV87990.1 response regulator transcription factor [Blastocatellia bacterium]HMX30183.1 response regulator transcription factor [Blastocatellia bacterium]HMY75977.1 response regulator transcription factor [Blastocatellia bacterium]HMZ23250.1 response regulator transcription factor [Blastocatellia bacterium]